MESISSGDVSGSTRNGMIVTAREVKEGLDPAAPVPNRREVAESVLLDVCAIVGLDARDAWLVRWVGNAVFRLPRHPVIMKVMTSPSLTCRARAAVAAANLLAAHGVPAVRLWPSQSQPLLVNDHAVTIWRYEDPVGPSPTGEEMGRLINRLRAVPVVDVDLPRWNPVGPIRSRIAEAEDVEADDIAFLSGECDDIEERLPEVDYALPESVVHGDAHLANVVPTGHGPVWCDFDGTCLGPAEWDLIPAAVASIRFPGPDDVHRQLVRTCGLDVTRWTGFPVFRKIREVNMLTSVLPNLRGNPRVRHEFQHRLRSLRSGDSHARWHRYA
jgi:hypothetical protein